MASAQWNGGKVKSTTHAKALFRHNSKERREYENHSNTDIDKSRTHLNFSYRGLDYKGRCEALDKRLSEIDMGRPGSGKNARTLMQSIVVYAPAALRGDLQRLRIWFHRVGEIAEEKFGAENVIDMAVDVDEVHKYTDAETLEERLAVEHGHLWTVPVINGKLAGDAFSKRARIVAFNDALQDMTEREFGCKWNDGTKRKRRDNVEQLKAASLRAEVEQLGERAETIIGDAIAQATEIVTDATRNANATRREADRDRAEAKRLRGAAWYDAQEAEDMKDDADEYARTTRRRADQDAKETRARADRDAQATREAAERDAERIRAQAQKDAQAVQERLRAKMEAELDEKRKEYKQLQDAHRSAQDAAQRDLMGWDAQEARNGLKSLLAASGAVVDAYTLPAVKAREINQGISSAMERLRQTNARNEARWASSGLTSVEGPTM